MTLRFSTYFSLLLAGLVLVGCQEEQLVTPSETIDDSASFDLVDDFAAEDAEMLKLDADEYVSSAELAAMVEEQFAAKGDALQKNTTNRRGTTVYTLTNSVVDNEVIVFDAADDGTLTESGRFRTQGQGSDDNLANQGALFLDNRSNLLYAINAGSNELTVFGVNRNGSLGFLDKIATQGERPVSVTAYENVIYVVNAGTDNVEGFRLNRNGRLRQMNNSVRPLSSTGTAPAQISFKPNGQALLVTEKATNQLTSYRVNRAGRLSRPSFLTAANNTPFGFDFLSGRTIVSEAAGGNDGLGTASVYRLRNDGTVRLLSGPTELGETATCWISANRRTGNVFATNTASSNISSLALAGNDLAITNGGQTTPAPTIVHDAGQNREGTYLYAVTIGSDEVLSYRIGDNGSLVQIDTDPTLADFASGIVVRR
ncbi:beta-propeller fold lactonase family protein [Lewinella sp. 4G2]|uniref:lactonase family protein n=1 Tax=Lewinella sp. 4G2 TaxID=1803372 RepID=UPI0007B46CE8|nr:beta-propeller fold lactonase family protein [Lewinella sp. 4G2]OAV46218.1 hypothetical protein A3850_018355 [Lewinella sp. 4G2]